MSTHHKAGVDISPKTFFLYFNHPKSSTETFEVTIVFKFSFNHSLIYHLPVFPFKIMKLLGFSFKKRSTIYHWGACVALS